MFVIHHSIFADSIIEDLVIPKSISSGTKILVQFEMDKDVTKHEILKKYAKECNKRGVSWIKPLSRVTEEWIFDLEQLKQSYSNLLHHPVLQGELTIEPKYKQHKIRDPWGEYEGEELPIARTELTFLIDPKEIEELNIDNTISQSIDLINPIKKFKKDHSDYNRCGFLMMKYEDTKIQRSITESLKSEFKKHSLKLLRADEKYYSDELLPNIRTYMHCCSFGVAVFDRINSNEFNPNVSLEIGYMMALKKPILLLKDKTLPSLHTDLVSKLYEEFNFQDIDSTVHKVVSKWINSSDLLKHTK
jgi:nucleoside 2-deoxyribosyltransferase